MSREYVLGVDLDDVVAKYTDYFRDFVAEYMGRDSSSMPDPEDWDFADWGIEDREHFIKLHTLAIRCGMFSEMDLMPGSLNALRALKNNGIRISIVTSRLAHVSTKFYFKIMSDTARFLDTHSVPHDDVLFLEDKYRYSFDKIVEDAPHHLEAIEHRFPGRAIIFDRPYNRGVLGRRAYSWNEVFNIVMNDYNESMSL